MWGIEFIVQMVSAVIATVSFAILFRLRAKYLPWAAIGGGVAYLIYYVINGAFGLLFAASFFASVFSAVYSEICARLMRAPAIIFIFPCAISIVPGGSLYRTMVSLISKDHEAAWAYLGQTMTVAMGIAGGLMAISLIFHIAAGARTRLTSKNK